MPQITHIDHGMLHAPLLQTTPVGGADAPAELRGARPSAGAMAGRVFAGIFTLGISEGIRAIVRHVRAGNAPQARVPAQGVPQASPRADLTNRGIASGLWDGALPPAYGAAVQEAITELRARFGEDLIPEGTTFKTLPAAIQLRQSVDTALTHLTDEVSPQALRDVILEKGAPLMAPQLLQRRAAERAAGLSESTGAALLGENILRQHPDLATDLRGCENRAAVDRVLDAAVPRINAYCDMTRAIDGAKVSARAFAVTELARQTGLPETVIREQVDFGKLENSWIYLAQDFLSGARQLEGEAIAAAFTEKAAQFAEQKGRLFTSVDTLGLSPALADVWKADALRQKTVNDSGMFATLHAIGSQVNAGSLMTALASPEGELTDREILGLMESLGMNLNERLLTHYGPAAWEELGGDGQGDARFYAAQAMLDAVPGLREALGNRPDLVARLDALAGEDMEIGWNQADSTDPHGADGSTQLRQSAMNVRMMLVDLPRPAAESNRDLAASFGRPEMSPAHVLTLNQGIAELRARFGQDSLPAGDAFRAISAWNPAAQSSISKLLSDAIRTAELPVSSNDLGRLLETNARFAAASGAFRGLLGEMARDMGLSLDNERIAAVGTALRQRHPQLADALSQAANRAEIKALLDSFPEAASLLRVESDIQTAWARGLDAIYGGIREVTGLSEEDVRSRLNLGAVDRGGRFHYRQQDIREACGKPDTSPDAIPSSEQIRGDYQKIVDGFLTNKRGLYQSVDTLGLSPALAASWKDEVLTSSTLKSADFLRKCAHVAERMTDSGLLAALNEPAMRPSDLLGVFRSIGAQLDEQAHAVFSRDEFEDMGSDDLSALNAHARQAFLDRRTDIVAAMRANADRMRELQDLCEQELGAIQQRMGRVSHTSPQMGELQAEYASMASALSIIGTAVPME